jgi:CRISPR-associated protein Csy3
MATKRDLSSLPSVLAFSRSLELGNFKLDGAPKMGSNDLRPVHVREEPLRGLNATAKSTDEERSQAVLQVVEAAEMPVQTSVLVLTGFVKFIDNLSRPHSCNKPEFAAAHEVVVKKGRAEGDLDELARRYAIRLATAGFTWRNLELAERHQVRVTAGDKTWLFDNLLPDPVNPMSLDAETYAPALRLLEELSNTIAAGLKGEKRTHLEVRADLLVGEGARVYPSQEWSSADSKGESKRRWPGGEGVTRVLAKTRLPDGSWQGFVNARKAGNALRVIDTWYPGATPDRPIAIEPYGANSHAGEARRKGLGENLFDIAAKAGRKEELKREERLFYLAACIRGGVFGAAGE